MREKLIELLVNMPGYIMGTEGLADYLIDNGVIIPNRCKDCVHRVEQGKMCTHPKAIGWDAIEPEDDDFCSYGERRTDNG